MKALITTVPFGNKNKLPLEILANAGIDYTINPIGRKLKEDELAELIVDFDLLIAGTEPITKKVIENARNLKLISRVGIGLDSVDLLAAKDNKILVSYTPDAPAPAVAELTLGMIFSLLRHLHLANTIMHRGEWERFFGRRITEVTVGIIGAGPAGLAAAEQLRKLGYQITVYDRYDRPGGLLIYGIPNFKLEKFVVERRTKLLEKSGIKFIQSFEVGKDASLNQLRVKHDVILIATGVYKARDIELPGNDLRNIFPAMEFLTASNRKGLGDKVELFDDGTLNAQDKNVVVIGGGDTAMDCVRTAVRQKAKSVKCIYRRDRENMPGSAREVGNAIEEGVEFIWLTAPKKFIGERVIKEVQVNKMKLGLADASGRKKPELEENSEYNIKADIIIKSLGFYPENLPELFSTPELLVSRWGTIKIDLDTMQTNMDGVFAAGDIVRGASLVVWAIKDGRDAAENINKYLKEKAIEKNKTKAA